MEVSLAGDQLCCCHFLTLVFFHMAELSMSNLKRCASARKYLYVQCPIKIQFESMSASMWATNHF